VNDHAKFDRDILTPMFKRTYDKYVSHDPSKIMMFETTQFTDIMGILGGIVWNAGYSEPPGGSDTSNQLLNEHTYCC